MRKLIIYITTSIAATTVLAQEHADSMKIQNLNEVVVAAQMQRTTATSTTYIPTGKQKNAAQNAIDLLRQMAISQIRINPINEVVTDNAGGNVSIFINYLEASKEEMEGLLTADVRRVEYLEFPADPRFRGAERVINIIVQEYAYGGYTKVTANENFLIGLSSRVNSFSKFSYKKMTYDLYAGANNWNTHHQGQSIDATYSLMDNNGTPYALNRKEELTGSHYVANQYPVTFRATYSSDKAQIRNMVAYTHQNTSINEQTGALIYTPSLGSDHTFYRDNPAITNSFFYSGSFFFSLPKDFSLDISPNFRYTHGNDNLSYTTSNAAGIVRNARENAYNYRIDAYLQKRISPKHTVMLGFGGGENANRLHYYGNSEYDDRFSNKFAAGLFVYQFKAQRFSIYSDAGLCWEESDINSTINNDVYPFLHINARYTPSQQQSLSAYFQFANNTPGINDKASDILQDNEFMYISGNPMLDNSRHVTLNLAYTWMPSNAFSVSAYGNYFELYDRQMTVYESYNNGQALMKTNINSGNYIQSEVGIAANWKLLDGKLQLYISPKQSFYRSTGIYHDNYNPFFAVAQASYYLGSYYFQAYYQSPQNTMFSNAPIIHKSRNFHSLTAGWANSNWNIRIMAANIFNRGWDSASQTISSPLYTQNSVTYGTDSHPRINLSVTYTLGYGKKVQRDNEVGEQSGASSAILK